MTIAPASGGVKPSPAMLRAMRPNLSRLRALLLALPLGGCWLEPAIGPVAVVSGASIILTGATPVDHVASLVTGQNCSVVHLERREPWCAPAYVAPVQPFCTRSLGAVDCWAWPPPGSQRQAADPPAPR